MRFLGGMVAAGLIVHSAAAGAMEPRDPSGRWVVDFNESQCVASIPYGEKGEEEYLAFKPIPTGTQLQIAVIVDGNNKRAAVDDHALIINGVEQPAQMLRYGTDEKQVYRYLINSPVRDMAAFHHLQMKVPGKNFDFNVTKMKDIATLLGDCLDDLREQWNVSDAGIKEQPSKTIREAFSSDDYPLTAWNQRQSGIARAFLLVDENGKIVDCTISAFVGNVILAAQSCAIIQSRVTLEPARDEEGNAIRSSIRTPLLSWQMMGSGKSMNELKEEMRRIEDADANCIDY